MISRSDLSGFPVRPRRFRLVASRDSDVYRLDADEGTFAVRHHRVGVTGDTVRAELAWLAHLTPALPERVPEPVGEVVEVDGRPVSMVRWVRGRFPRKPTRRLAEEIGQALAEIHEASRGFAPPSGVRRWDASDHFSSLLLTKIRRVTPLMSAEDAALAIEQAEMVAAMFAELPRDTETGMLHGDLYGLNCLFRKEGLGIIDFANGGPGPLAYDLGVAVRHLPSAVRRWVLSGYRSVRPLPFDGDLSPMIRARVIMAAAYAADRLDQPGGGYEPARLIEWTVRSLRLPLCPV